MNINELSYFGKELEKNSNWFTKSLKFAFTKDIMPKSVKSTVRKYVPKNIRGAAHSAAVNTGAIGTVGTGMVGWKKFTDPKSIYHGDVGRFAR